MIRFLILPIVVILCLSCEPNTRRPYQRNNNYNVDNRDIRQQSYNETLELDHIAPVVDDVPRVSPEKVIRELERTAYFNLVPPAKRARLKAEFLHNYKMYRFFQGPIDEETLKFKDRRCYWVDCEQLFLDGGLKKYLREFVPLFRGIGLKLDIGYEKSEQSRYNWLHTIEVNGTEYIAYNGPINDHSPERAYINLIKILNKELKIQRSRERFYPVSCGKEGTMMFLTKKQFDFIKYYYPDNNEHPTTIIDWKSKNGLYDNENYQ